MEQRHITGKSHWYHETQSSTSEYDVLPLVPGAAKVTDPFLLDVILDEETLDPFHSWLIPARALAVEFFPDQLAVTRLQTFTAYERLTTALTVAQVCGVQRLCNYYSARLTPLPGPDSSRERIIGWRKSRNMPVNWLVLHLLSTVSPASILTMSGLPPGTV